MPSNEKENHIFWRGHQRQRGVDDKSIMDLFASFPFFYSTKHYHSENASCSHSIWISTLISPLVKTQSCWQQCQFSLWIKCHGELRYFIFKLSI